MTCTINFATYNNCCISDTFAKGSNFHQCVQDKLEGKPEDELTVSTENDGHWKSIQSVFGDINDVHFVEEKVSHPYLSYRGIFDCVATFR